VKTCTRCGQEKPLAEFYRGKDRDGHQHCCKVCNNRYKTARLADPIKRAENNAKARERRQANPSRARAWGLAHYYRNREKRNAANRLWRQAHPESQKKRDLRAKYRLTVDAFNALWAKQSGKCGVCQEPLRPGRTTHVDHDHNNGAVRGLLCGPCNWMLGCAKDRPDALRAGAAYLEAPSSLQ
jgi:hypothetical protein